MIWTLALAAAAMQGQAAACEAQIIDYSTWREAPNQGWDYRWRGGAGSLTIIGADHQRDAAHPQFAGIEQAFREAAPELVFFEGPDRGIGSDPADTISSRGESGFLRFLARASGIEARTLEPSPSQQIGMLLAEFPLDQVNLFFVLREASRMRDREGLSGAALDAAVAQLIARSGEMARGAGLALPVMDLASLDAQARRYWPDRDWRALPASWFAPSPDQEGARFLNAINRADSRNRDRHMVRLLSDAAREGKKVFVVVGRNHVPMQAPALDCALRGQD